MLIGKEFTRAFKRRCLPDANSSQTRLSCEAPEPSQGSDDTWRLGGQEHEIRRMRKMNKSTNQSKVDIVLALFGIEILYQLRTLRIHRLGIAKR